MAFSGLDGLYGPGSGTLGCSQRRLSHLRTDSSCGAGPLMEDQAVEVVGDVGQDQFRLGAGKTVSRLLHAIACRPANGADKQPEAVLLVRKDMLDRPARIDDLPALARAMCFGIGRPAGLRRWIRLTSIFDASHFSFFCDR